MALAGILYTLQLYADFSGCIDMTIGFGEMFGLTLPENFRQPFLQRTRRSSGAGGILRWARGSKDYIFYPLSLTGGIKKLGKSARKAGQALWPDRADADPALCGMAVQWRVAWHRLDVPVLWYVLLLC